MKPKFKKKEIVIEKPNDSEIKFGGGNNKECVAIIKYIGSKVENYEVGDKILFNMDVARLEINYFDKPLLRIEHEDYVICEIDEENE